MIVGHTGHVEFNVVVDGDVVGHEIGDEQVTGGHVTRVFTVEQDGDDDVDGDIEGQGRHIVGGDVGGDAHGGHVTTGQAATDVGSTFGIQEAGSSASRHTQNAEFSSHGIFFWPESA